jgi:hypothetical protein
MKRAICILSVAGIGLLWSTFAQAQERTEETVITSEGSSGTSDTTKRIVITDREDLREFDNMVMIDPIKFMMWINASYYRVLSDRMALGATAQVASALFRDDVSGFGLQADVLFYPAGKVFRGFRLGGMASFSSVTQETFETTGPISVTDNPTTIGPMIGWTSWFTDDLAIDLSIGGEFTLNNISYAVWPYWQEESGKFYPFMSAKIGYAW